MDGWTEEGALTRCDDYAASLVHVCPGDFVLLLLLVECYMKTMAAREMDAATQN